MAQGGISVEIIDRASVRLHALPEDIRRRLRVVIVRDGKEMAAIIRGKLGGGVVKVRSGRLVHSVKTEMVENKLEIYGRVYSAGVPYARIVAESGGKTRPHMIYPKTAQALHFMIGGRHIFARAVHHPGSKFPAKHVFSGTLSEMKSRIVANITEAGRPKW